MQNYMPNSQISYNNSKPAQTAQQSMPSQPVQPQYQTPPAANPNYAGVNIQIINPMVNPNGGYIYPQQTNSAFNPGTQGGCYPSNYYTTQPGTYIPGGGYPGYPYPQPGSTRSPGGTQTQGATTPNGFYDQNGKYHPYVQGANGEIGYYDENGKFQPLNQDNNIPKTDNGKENIPQPETPSQNPKAEDINKNGFYDKDGKFHEYTKGANGETGYYDENGQFHPVDPNNPGGTDVKDDKKAEETKPAQADTSKEQVNEAEKEASKETEKSDDSKTKKKKVVVLSNDYIKTLENYLNSQDVEVRKMGAHEVVDRLSEDSSRKDDPALTALVNKMLQDPSTAIRTIALSLVESRTVSGDDYTVKLLKNMQNTKDGFGLDANQATSALLKMSGKTVEKEVPVDETTKDNNNSEKEKK